MHVSRNDSHSGSYVSKYYSSGQFAGPKRTQTRVQRDVVSRYVTETANWRGRNGPTRGRVKHVSSCQTRLALLGGLGGAWASRRVGFEERGLGGGRWVWWDLAGLGCCRWLGAGAAGIGGELREGWGCWARDSGRRDNDVCDDQRRRSRDGPCVLICMIARRAMSDRNILENPVKKV